MALTLFQKPEVSDYLASYANASTVISTPYLVQGFVWLHPDSYQIMRMETSMVAPAGFLWHEATKIDYQEVQFEGGSHSFWLPAEVIVNMNAHGVLCRNQHRYSEYKLFDIQSDYKITLPKTSNSTPSKPAR